MECIKRLYKEILKDSALPGLTKRLTMTSWPCPTCGKTCDHRKVYAFSDKVNNLFLYFLGREVTQFGIIYTKMFRKIDIIK